MQLDPEENEPTPVDGEPTPAAPAETAPVVDENAAALSAATAKIASLTIELEAVKAELISTKAANWDLSQLTPDNTGGDAAVTDPENATENDDDGDDVEDFFGDRED